MCCLLNVINSDIAKDIESKIWKSFNSTSFISVRKFMEVFCINLALKNSHYIDSITK